MIETTSHEILALFQAGRHREVVDCGRAAGISVVDQPLLAQVLAASLFRLGRYSEALQLLEPLDGALGQQVDFLSLYGATCRRLGQLQRAGDLFAKAMALDPLSQQVRNNYANLLIDLDRFSEAEQLLNTLLKEQPDYEDARANLNRLRFKQQAAVAPQPIAPVAAGTVASWDPLDPLMLAFSDDEVAQAGGVSAKPPSPPALGQSAAALMAALPQPDQAARASEQLDLAQKAINEGNPSFALQLCSQAHAVLGATQTVYTNASDGYIRLQRFLEAEICLLTGIALGNATVNHYINLVSLASLRGDLALAAHYLDAAAAIDPENPALAQVRSQYQQRAAQHRSAGRPYQFLAQWAQLQLQVKATG